MELADQDLIASLLSGASQPALGQPPAPPIERECAPACRQPRRGCRCGRCRLCRDNARWERIYQQRFADPDYYTRVAVRYESPISRF